MRTSDLYHTPKECCGCEACAQVCPKSIVIMKPDAEGFIYPTIIDEDKCINCKSCLNVCPLKHQRVQGKSIIKSYGGYSKDQEQIKQCASGGFATVLSSNFIKNGGIVYGVEYNPDDVKDVRFTRCSHIDQLERLKGSKYTQARKYDIFQSVQKDLKDGLKVLFIGLPCEVAGLYNYLIKEYASLYTVNLICHGPTSPKVHSEYISQLLSSNINKTINFFSVRNKQESWKPYFIKAIFDDGKELIEEFMNSNYGIAFRQLKRPSCSNCCFKINEKSNGIKADLTIGDFHLAHHGMPQYNHWGSSQISVLSKKGQELLDITVDNFNSIPISNYQAIHYNAAFFKPIPAHWNRNSFSSTFKRKGLDAACKLKSAKLVDDFVRLKKLCKTKIAHFSRMIKR